MHSAAKGCEIHSVNHSESENHRLAMQSLHSRLASNCLEQQKKEMILYINGNTGKDTLQFGDAGHSGPE